MKLAPLLALMYEPLVRTALLEDLGRAGDITADAIVLADQTASLVLRARQPGVVAGLDIARCASQLVNPAIQLTAERPDGSVVAPGDVIATIEGPARGLLTAERTALNFLCHLSGVATATASLVAAAQGTRARIVCTRKTTPGLRALEKYAVRAGGGANHRFGLDDAFLIKDNHIALAGDVRTAIERAKAHAGHLVKIEIEVDTLAQLERHVIEQHGIHADRKNLFKLGQRVDLDLDLDEMAGMRFCALDRGSDVAGQRDVVVLDQNGVIEAKAVIAAAAGADRVFFQRAQSGRGLAGTNDARLGALRGRHQRGRRGGDAAEMAEKVECGPFAGQQPARRPFDGRDHISRRDDAAIRSLGGEPDGRIDELKGTARDVEPGHHAGLARAQHQRRLLVGRDDRIGRDVAGAA